MASRQTQVSAFISDSTKDALEQYAEAHGLKKAFLIEEALLHHLQALRELPLDVIISARLVVSRDSGQAMLERVTRPRRPTKAMRESSPRTVETGSGRERLKGVGWMHAPDGIHRDKHHQLSGGSSKPGSHYRCAPADYPHMVGEASPGVLDVASQVVLDESAAGDPKMASKRMEILRDVPLLEITPGVA